MEVIEQGDILRATEWNEFFGQQALKDRLQIHINAALAGNRMLDHILLIAPPGAGKSSIAGIIAKRIGDAFRSFTMPVKPEVLAGLITEWQDNKLILLLDEVHRAPKALQEDLLNVLENKYFQTARGRRIECPNLTIIGATTEPEKIIPPLWDRFPIKPEWTEYSGDEMALIIIGMADKVDIEMSIELAFELGQAAAGIPRQARQLVLAARDLEQNRLEISAQSIVNLCGISLDGLTSNHRKYLNTLKDLGGQAGMDTLSSMLRLHPSVIQDLERLLVSRRLVDLSGRGRELTGAGWNKVRITHHNQREVVTN